MHEVVKLKRKVTAVQVPFGETTTLAKNTEVTITQALGGSYTVTARGNMYRIESKDADSLGKTNENLPPPKNENDPLEDKVWHVLRSCYDPEIPINIVDLGLIYGIDITEADDKKSKVTIRMTLTAPGCGMGPIIMEDVREKVSSLSEVKEVIINLVFDPPWDRSMMSEQAKLELGLL
jgi:probable FeS assembly SUF system protein SufT